MRKPTFIPSERRVYAFRMAGSVIASLILVTAAVRLWPVVQKDDQSGLYDAQTQEVVTIEEIAPTRQDRQKPPPPAPAIPVVVPDDIVLDVEEIQLMDVLDLAETSTSDSQGVPAPPSEGVPSMPDAGPRVVRFIQPEYSREAQRRNIRAEVVVEVRVSDSGRVENTRVVNRYLLGKDAQSREPVNQLGYGLEEAAMAAAEQCMFRPARIDGKRAGATTTLTFTFGV